MTGRASKPRKPAKSTRPDDGDPGGGPVASARQRTASLFPPHALREYALLADGERGALIGPKGDIAWMCAPSWDSGSVFSSLIGGSGVYAIWPADRFTWGGFYEAGSLIWHSRWVTDADAITECREALAFPGEPGRLVLLRRIMACDGTARVRVRLQPRADYDRRPLRQLHQDAAGLWTGRAGDLYLRWSGAVGAATAASRQGGALLELTLRVDEGRHADLVLELSDRPFDGPPPDPDEAWAATEHGWQQAVPKLEKVTARRDAVHAYAVMRGLTSAGNGMVAAATTSLPERAAAGRNYDYRYAWIRDQCYAGSAAAAVGGHPLLDQAVRFVAARLHEDGPKLRPAYTTTGGRVPDQAGLRLPGYPGGFDQTGNWVNKQFQLDAFGEALLLFADAARLDRLDADAAAAVQIAAAAIEQRWQEPDAGIWEIDDQAWTHSRLTCAAGLRSAAAACAAGTLGGRWIALADAIVADTAKHALHPSGRWQRSPADPGLDGALLLAGLRGAVPADDPRTTATLSAYEEELVSEGYAYRFRHDDRPLADAEGAFLLCNFVLSLALLQQGDAVEAARFFERARAACGPPGLYAEEFDVHQRQLRGNLPQAFVHALLLECAGRLSAVVRL
jgi:alpha,alpha-trehalase